MKVAIVLLATIAYASASGYFQPGFSHVRNGVAAPYRNADRQRAVNNVAENVGAGTGTARFYGVPGAYGNNGRSSGGYGLGFGGNSGYGHQHGVGNGYGHQLGGNFGYSAGGYGGYGNFNGYSSFGYGPHGGNRFGSYSDFNNRGHY